MRVEGLEFFSSEGVTGILPVCIRLSFLSRGAIPLPYLLDLPARAVLDLFEATLEVLEEMQPDDD